MDAQKGRSGSFVAESIKILGLDFNRLRLQSNSRSSCSSGGSKMGSTGSLNDEAEKSNEQN